MQSDFEIGRVVAVDTAQVTIELNRDMKGLTRSTYEGAQEVGRINSYVIIPVGARRLVAMVTKVFLTEEAELIADRTMVTLPSARRLVKATLIGTLDGNSYSQGIASFPVLDNPVHLVTSWDLNIIFDCQIGGEAECEIRESRQDPGFCIHLGHSPIFEGFPIQINPDVFFGKHAAILGSTGSGKSCTIVSILQSILLQSEVKKTHFVILDTNGEYRSAFQRSIGEGIWENIPEFASLYIPSNPQEEKERLVIPYWFMNSDDFIRLFRASAGIQRPVLLDALRISRSPEIPGGDAYQAKDLLLRELHRIISYAEDSGKISAEVEDIANGCLKFLEDREEILSSIIEDSSDDLKITLSDIAKMSRDFVGEPDKRRFSKPLPLNVQQKIRSDLFLYVEKLASGAVASGLSQISADTPVYFSKTMFKNDYIEKAMRRDEAGGSRARDYCATMLMRIYRLLEDRRFEFLFGPVRGELPKPEHSLAAFICDLLGMNIENKSLSSTSKVRQGQLPFYDRQRDKGSTSNVIILDLSLLASEVLENVTALVGRLILEFLQRLGEHGGEKARGSVPVVLVLEEAQNYIHESRFGEEDSISRIVFERIAREGRKFGLSLVVASQRPSELSKTVLSQCSSFIVHRLQNPEDLRYFKDIVPGIYDQLLNQLPALAPQTALVLGECVRAPALVKIREANPMPRSRDPKFYSYWIAEDRKKVPVEEVCEMWEGKK